MVRDGTVSGDMYGDRVYHDRVSFAQGAAGAGFNFVKKDTDIWYVDSGKTGPASSGDGTTWDKAVMTLAEAVALAGDHDTILIGSNDIETVAATGIDITQEGLKILGSAKTSASQNCAFKCTGTAAMLRIASDRVEIAGITLSQRGAYTCIEIGTAGDGSQYETHIHHCNFDGYGTSTYGVSGYGQTGDTVGLVVEDCTFMSFATAAIHASGSKDTYRRNTIFVPTSTTGIHVKDAGGDKNWTVIVDNDLIGITDAIGIVFAAGAPTAGTVMLARNMLSGTWGTTITDIAQGIENYVSDASGGALINC